MITHNAYSDTPTDANTCQERAPYDAIYGTPIAASACQDRAPDDAPYGTPYGTPIAANACQDRAPYDTPYDTPIAASACQDRAPYDAPYDTRATSIWDSHGFHLKLFDERCRTVSRVATTSREPQLARNLQLSFDCVTSSVAALALSPQQLTQTPVSTGQMLSEASAANPAPGQKEASPKYSITKIIL